MDVCLSSVNLSNSWTIRILCSALHFALFDVVVTSKKLEEESSSHDEWYFTLAPGLFG